MIRRALQFAYSYATGRSPKWPSVRKAFLAGKRCAACSSSSSLEAHHILPVSYYPEHELNAEFLIALCRPCHYEHGHSGDWRAFNPRVVEDAALMLKRRRERCYRRLEVLK